MIRDEFKNADKKVIDKKANKKIKEMGERAYYAKKLSFYNDILKPVRFSTIFSLVSFCLLSALFLYSIIVTKPEKIEAWSIVLFVITGLTIIWSVVWFAILTPMIKRKTIFYKNEMMRLNREYVMKNLKR
ncbi:MAG: hypothetical protein IKJ19_06915 [Clostridia bacterium]|nr:hypothetical protein [Clostridia bacterium]